MRSKLAFILLLAGVAQACASVQIFYTAAHEGYGLVHPEYDFWPTEGSHRDITDGYYAVSAFPEGMHNTVASIGETVYVWLRFNNEVNSRKINGIDMDASDGNPDAAAWYILDDTLGDTGQKRWDGAYSPGAPEFRTPHKVLVAATGYGIKNLNASNPSWLWEGGTTRTTILGAVRFDTPGEYTLALGTAGINYSGGYSAPTVEFGSVIVPEPAAIVLLGLAGLTIRRR